MLPRAFRPKAAAVHQSGGTSSGNMFSDAAPGNARRVGSAPPSKGKRLSEFSAEERTSALETRKWRVMAPNHALLGTQVTIASVNESALTVDVCGPGSRLPHSVDFADLEEIPVCGQTQAAAAGSSAVLTPLPASALCSASVILWSPWQRVRTEVGGEAVGEHAATTSLWGSIGSSPSVFHAGARASFGSSQVYSTQVHVRRPLRRSSSPGPSSWLRRASSRVLRSASSRSILATGNTRCSCRVTAFADFWSRRCLQST